MEDFVRRAQFTSRTFQGHSLSRSFIHRLLLQLFSQCIQEHLEAFERERALLLRNNEEVQGSLEELSLKYAEILGHQNHRQKIKRVMQISAENSHMRQVGVLSSATSLSSTCFSCFYLVSGVVQVT